MKYINTYADLATYSASTASFSFPHVAFAVQEEQVKYDKDPSSLGYDIWGTVTDGTTSLTLTINNYGKAATVNNGYFMYNWTGGTITSLAAFIYNNSNVKTIEKIRLDTSNVTTMQMMFMSCPNLTSIDMSGVDASNVTTMDRMFAYSGKLTSIDMSGVDTSNVTNMSQMFYSCTGLTSLDLSNLNTSNATTMDKMFSACKSVTSFDLSNFNTSNVTNMEGMFKAVDGITTLDLSNFDTSKVTNMTEMFDRCSYKLANINISNWDMTNVTSISNMFHWCYTLTSITANNTNQTTLEKIQGQLVSDNVASHVTITRDGYNWNYSGGQWVSTPI